MPSSVPTPIAAAFGLVPTVLGGVRRLPGKAVQLPILALSTALTSVDAARREYDDLAQRGERLIAKLRGTSFDELEDRFEDTLEGSPFAKPYDVVEDALEDLTERVGSTLQRTSKAAGKRLDDAADAVEDAAASARGGAKQAVKATGKAADKAADKATEKTSEVADKAADKADAAAAKTGAAAVKAADTAEQVAKQAAPTARKAAKKAAGKAEQAAEKTAGKAGDAADKAAAAVSEVPEDEQPKGEPTPQATQPDSTRIDTAVSAEVEQTVEAVSKAAGSGEVVEHDQLPLPDYDHMTLGSLRGRMRSLTVEQLVQVRDYEKAHANRLPVVTMLDNRIAKLATDASAPPPSGTPSDRPAAGQDSTAGGSKVSPETGAPVQNPPSTPEPTNPAQART